MSFVLAVLIGLLLPVAARAADAADSNVRLASRVKDPELREMTLRLLREMNTDFSVIADRGLLIKGEKFDHARLEITGVMSADNTGIISPKTFDQFVKPSFLNREKLGFVDNVLESIQNLANPARTVALDVKDYRQAAAGVLTERAAKVLDKYRGKEINEIVAHSWGCELIYAAILNGQMNPPKKLIVVGVPDDDFAKWEELALRTGTAVVWVRAKNDMIAQAGAKLAKDDARSVDFKARWDAVCAISMPRSICDRRRPSVAARVVIDEIPGLTGHGRKEYYDVLKDRKIIRGTFLDLRATEWEVKAAEIKLVEEAAFDVALRAARGLIAQARAQAKIAQRDHDERLKRTYADMAIRSCASPGSVTQTELNALADPYDKDFVETPPGELGACAYIAYVSLGRGADAEQLRRNSIQVEPVVGKPIPQPVDASIRPSPFALTFPDLAKFAADSCRSPGSASPVLMNYFQRPREQFFGDRKNWESWYKDQLARLDGCPKLLFIDLVTMALEGSYWKVGERDWIEKQVARHSPSQPGSGGGTSLPPRSSPPQGCIPGDNSRRNCIACGNKYCP